MFEGMDCVKQVRTHLKSSIHVEASAMSAMLALVENMKAQSREPSMKFSPLCVLDHSPSKFKSSTDCGKGGT